MPLSDKIRWGVHLSFLSPDLAELVGALGFQWLLLDAQRTPLDAESCRHLVRAADVARMFCIVRVSELSAPEIESYLDAGVRGIIAPNISSAADARALVSAVKFAPEGTRSAAARSRAARYGLAQSPADFCTSANLSTLTGALIESKTGLDELDAIAAVPGLDYLSIGGNDLALSLGITAGASDPSVRTMVDQARSRIKALGKPQIAVVSDAEQARAAVSNGAALVAVSDAALLAAAGRSFLREIPS